MNYLVKNLLETVGAEAVELTSFSELIVWFVTVVTAIGFILFVLDSIFYTIKSVTRGIK